MHARSIWTKLPVLIFSVSLLVSCGGGGGGGGGGTPPPTSEGSLANPVNLGTVSTTITHAGSISADGTSFYKFTTGSTPGTATVSLTNTKSNLSWDLYSDSLFTASVGTTCNTFATAGSNNESCSIALAAGTVYYLAVDEWDSVAGTYTLTVNPPVPPVKPTGVSATAGYGKVTISWYVATGATSYNVYWSTTPGGASSGGTKISGITTTTYDHVVPATGVPYYYVVTAVNPNGESAKTSPEVSATPLAMQVPPLAYNFDTGTLEGWTTNGIWSVSTITAHSGTYSVTDSPLGNYQNSSNTWLASPMIDLTATTAPKLTYWHKYQLQADADFGYVELSSDGGVLWTNITPTTSYGNRYSGLTPLPFALVTIDLTAYKSSSTVVIRFRLQTSSSMFYDGWYIDDIGISAN